MSTDIRGNAAADFVAGGNLTPGEHLRAEIERLRLDQVKVSEATGVSRQSINNIINGRQPISRAMAGKLARLTGHSSDYWMRSSFPRTASGGLQPGALDDSEESARPLGVGVLVNHQIIRAVRDGIIAIEPFNESNVQLASIDLTLDDFVVTTEGEKVDITEGQGFILKGGRTVIVGTKEAVEFPQDYIGRVGPMASLAKNGIMTSYGFQVDPGFVGHLGFCIFNAGGKDFELSAGNPIISLEIMPLSVTPAHDERADKHLSDASDRENVVYLFRNDVCDRLIRGTIRDCVKVDVHNSRVKAKISELNLELADASADVALDAVVQGALNGLKTLRDKPSAAHDERHKYLAFFRDVAGGLNLNAEEARRAIACLGLPLENTSPLILPLRDGKEAMLHLPSKTATISFEHLAERLHEDPLDLLLMLVGIQSYQDAK